MSHQITRRQFARGLGASLALAAVSRPVLGAQQEQPATLSADDSIATTIVDDSVPTSILANPSSAPLNVYAGTTSEKLINPALAGLPPRVYVPHELGGDVAVIDPASMQVIDRFFVGRTPHHVGPAPDMSSLMVNVMDSNRLAVIDIHSGRVAQSIPAAVPYNLYFSPDGTKAIVAAEYFNRLDFYDVVTWEPLRRLQIPGRGVDHLDFSADGSFLMVSCEFGGELVKVDVHNMQVAGVVRVGGLPVDVKLSPLGDVFYVCNQGRHGVSVVDPEAMREVSFLPTGAGAHGMAISRDARAIYVSNRLAGTISVIDVEAAGIARSWRIGGSPDMVQVSPDGQQVWVSARYHGWVDVVDSNNGALLHRIRTGAGPHGLTYFPQPGSISLGHNGVYR
jgi:DNA-binding beta-propeller fold protein YncE